MVFPKRQQYKGYKRICQHFFINFCTKFFINSFNIHNIVKKHFKFAKKKKKKRNIISKVNKELEKGIKENSVLDGIDFAIQKIKEKANHSSQGFDFLVGNALKRDKKGLKFTKKAIL